MWNLYTALPNQHASACTAPPPPLPRQTTAHMCAAAGCGGLLLLRPSCYAARVPMAPSGAAVMCQGCCSCCSHDPPGGGPLAVKGPCHDLLLRPWAQLLLLLVGCTPARRLL
jgi:hypothetical protein